MMKSIKLNLPTCNVDLYPDKVAKGELPEYGSPHVSVTVEPSRRTLDILLGNEPYIAHLCIERHPKGWLIIVHGVDGSDPSSTLAILDDHRSFFVPEMDMGTTIVTEILDHDATVPEIQLPPED